MLAAERLLEIEQKYGKIVQRIALVELDGESLRLVLYLKDGTNLRIAEQWIGETLARYSYYWLDAVNALQIGWDNAPHHTRLANFPHHKHVGQQSNLQSAYETCLEEVMQVIVGTANERE